MHGAEELHARTGTVPVFGDRLELVFPSFVFALGVLPTLLVYRARAVVYALVAGGLAWFGGFAAWTHWPFVHARTMEALGAAIAGFFATLLVLGLAGDAKNRASRRGGEGLRRALPACSRSRPRPEDRAAPWYPFVMGHPAKRRATYDDLVAVPDHLVAEIVNGTLVTSPRPAARHTTASSILGGELGPPFHRGRGGPGGWVILDEPELHLHDDVLVPDLAGWRRERMPEIPDTAAFTLAPDWICEVLSPSTAALDRAEKMPIYARESVTHAWLVDPTAKTLEAYRLERERWLLLGAWRDDATARIAPFDAIELELAALWAR